MIAEVTSDLVATLSGMEVISEAIATFWILQSLSFSKHSKAMKTETTYSKPLLVHGVSQQNIEEWKKAKKEFDKYASVMTILMNLYNFSTEASAVPTREFHVDKLSFNLSIPENIDVQLIEANAE